MTEGIYTLARTRTATTTQLRLAVVGSREWESAEHLRRAGAMIAYAYGRYQPTQIVSGGAPGIDKLAETFARWLRIPTLIHHPPIDAKSWEQFKARNILIARDCTHLLCVRSHIAKTYGSGWTADYAENELGRPVHRIMMRPGESMPPWPDWRAE